MKDFWVDLRYFGKADLERFLGMFRTRGGRATKVDFELQRCGLGARIARVGRVVHLVLAAPIRELKLAGSE